MASKTSSRSRSVTASRISSRSEGKTASPSKSRRVPLSRRSTLQKKDRKSLPPRNRSRNSKIPAKAKHSAGSKTGEQRPEGNDSVGEEFFVYKNVQDLGREGEAISMDQGCAKQVFTSVSGCNAYCALALYSWLGRNCEAWGATEVKCELQESDNSGVARYVYDSMVLMRDGKSIKLYAEFYGRPVKE